MGRGHTQRCLDCILRSLSHPLKSARFVGDNRSGLGLLQKDPQLLDKDAPCFHGGNVVE